MKTNHKKSGSSSPHVNKKSAGKTYVEQHKSPKGDLTENRTGGRKEKEDTTEEEIVRSTRNQEDYRDENREYDKDNENDYDENWNPEEENGHSQSEKRPSDRKK